MRPPEEYITADVIAEATLGPFSYEAMLRRAAPSIVDAVIKDVVEALRAWDDGDYEGDRIFDPAFFIERWAEERSFAEVRRDLGLPPMEDPS